MILVIRLADRRLKNFFIGLSYEPIFAKTVGLYFGLSHLMSSEWLNIRDKALVLTKWATSFRSP